MTSYGVSTPRRHTLSLSLIRFARSNDPNGVANYSRRGGASDLELSLHGNVSFCSLVPNPPDEFTQSETSNSTFVFTRYPQM